MMLLFAAASSARTASPWATWSLWSRVCGAGGFFFTLAFLADFFFGLLFFGAAFLVAGFFRFGAAVLPAAFRFLASFAAFFFLLLRTAIAAAPCKVLPFFR